MGRYTASLHSTTQDVSVCDDGCEISTQPDCGQAGVAAALAGLVCPTLHPPVQHGDLGRTENVDVDVFSLEAHRGYFRLRHLADRDVPDMVPHQGDPGPLQHVRGEGGDWR